MPSKVEDVAADVPLASRDLSQGLPKLVPRRRVQKDDAQENPPPPTPALPEVPLINEDQFVVPTRRILSEEDHAIFMSSQTHDLIVSFVFSLADSVQDLTVSKVKSSPAASDPSITSLITILDQTEAILAAHPPLDTGSRFGNPAFRTFLSAVESAHTTWHQTLLPNHPTAIPEVSTYFLNSFGSSARIDYGSGHELNFLLWLLCLRQLSYFPTTTSTPTQNPIFPALTLLVFPRYIHLMRRIQTTYYLEPAGSHGVWGLDDYQFAPFLFGASQLSHHPFLRPKSIHTESTVDECKADYLYFDQVAFVNASKTVRGLRWHSPMLDDISASRSWAKIEAGMRRVFLREVLGKLPVAQHLLFGSLIAAVDGMGGGDGGDGGEGGQAGTEEVEGMKHVHMHNVSSWGDCCGIKVPSAVGAMQEARKHAEAGGLRRLPFD